VNAKEALFFPAFVPQFIEPGAPHKALAFVFLGTISISPARFGVYSLLGLLHISAAGRFKAVKL